MEWHEYTVWLSDIKAVEAAGELLRALGCAGVMVRYPNEFYNSEYLLETWAYLSPQETKLAQEFVSASGYFIRSIPPDVLTRRLNYLEQVLQVKTFWSQHRLSDSCWQNAWKKYFYPQKIGGRLIIKPSWEDYTAAADEVVVELDPGMAFGTGLHASTRFCLELLEISMQPGDAVLDAGTGSGILAIAAAKLGAAQVDAWDLDAKAVETASANVQHNQQQSVITVTKGNVLQLQQPDTYEIIVANLTAEIILLLLRTAYVSLRSKGIFIISGILQERWPSLQTELAAAGFNVAEKRQDETWVAAACRKKQGIKSNPGYRHKL